MKVISVCYKCRNTYKMHSIYMLLYVCSDVLFYWIFSVILWVSCYRMRRRGKSFSFWKHLEKNFFFNLLESIRSLHSRLYLSLHGYHMRFWKAVVHQRNVNLEYLLMKAQSNLNFLIQNLEIDNAVKNIWGGNGRVVKILIQWPEHIDFLIYILFSPLSYSSFFKVGVY